MRDSIRDCWMPILARTIALAFAFFVELADAGSTKGARVACEAAIGDAALMWQIDEEASP